MEFDHIPDGPFGGTYFVKLPEGYKEPNKFPFSNEEYEKNFYRISGWVEKQLAKHSLFPEYTSKQSAIFVNTIHLLRRIDQTRYLINQEDSNEWAENVEHYTNAMILCFTRPYVGLPFYIKEIQAIIRNNIHAQNEKKRQLLKFLETYHIHGKIPDFYEIEFVDSKTMETVGEKNKFTPDTFIPLKKIFNEWLEIFPFEIGCFDKDKKYFQERLANFLEKRDGVENKYTGHTSNSIRRPHELIEFLIETTNEMLQCVNSVEWGRMADLSEIKRRSYEIEDAQHSLKQKTLLDDFNKKTANYVKILKTWLQNEKTYFDCLIKRSTELQLLIDKKETEINGCEPLTTKGFSDYLTCSEHQKQTIIERIKTISPSVPDGRSWAIVILALNKINVLTLPNIGKNKIYEAFRKEFRIKVSDKNFNQYIGNYLGKSEIDSGVPISDHEIDAVIQKIQ